MNYYEYNAKRKINYEHKDTDTVNFEVTKTTVSYGIEVTEIEFGESADSTTPLVRDIANKPIVR